MAIKWQTQVISEDDTMKYVKQFKYVSTNALYYSVKFLHLKH